MAFSKDIKDAESELRNFTKTLSQIQRDYTKALSDANKQTSELPKNWSDVGKKIVDSITLTGRLNSQLIVKQKQLEAGKIKEKSLYDSILSSNQKRKDIEDKIKLIGAESSKIITDASSQKRKLTTIEKDRLKLLSSEESSLRLIERGMMKKQKNAAVELKDQQSKNKKLSESINVLNAQLAMLMLIKSTFVLLYNIADRYDKVLQKIANDVGIGRIEAEKFVPALSAAASKSIALGATLADAGSAAKELVDQFELVGTMALEDINQQMLVLNKAFGVALTDSAKFYSTLTQVGNSSLESQTYMTGVADAAAKAAGVPLGKVIKDVANITLGVRLIFKGNTAELIKQVAEARKLGTSLDSAAKSAESLLDFESSIGNELKASALLGKNVNFNESRRLFFNGKILEGEKALIRELDTVGDLNELNFFQRKAIAQLTGKEFSELQKIQAQRKQQLSIDSKFPELAKEREEQERKLSKIMGSTEAQQERALEMQARDNVANARANVLAAQKEQILVNISRIMQPLYRLFTLAAESVLKWGVSITETAANFAKAHPIVTGIAVAILGVASAFGTVRLAMALWSRGLIPLGTSITAFLTSIATGITALSATGPIGIGVLLSLAAAFAAVGVAAWGIGKILEGAGVLIRSILEPSVKLVEVLTAASNAFVANIGTAMLSIASGIKQIADVGIVKITKAAFGIGVMATSITDLGMAIGNFPTSSFSGFASNLESIASVSATTIDKLSTLFENAKLSDGKIMIGIDKDAVTSINKLSDLNSDKQELKTTIESGNQKVVETLNKLINLMTNGGIAINMDGQSVQNALSRANLRSGGFGQSTTLA